MVKRRRRTCSLRYSLRTLLVVIVVSAIGLAFLNARRREASVQRRNVATIRQAGGVALYSYQVKWNESDLCIEETGNDVPQVQGWLLDMLGVDFFCHVVDVSVSTPQKTAKGVAASSSDVVEAVMDFRSLKRLELNSCPLPVGSLRRVSELPQLRELVLWGCEFDELELVHLGECPRLQVLTIRYSVLSAEGAKHLAAIKNLQQLDIAGTDVGDAALLEILKNRSLKAITLTGTSVTNECLNALAEHPGLEFVDLLSTDVSANGVRELRNVRPRLSVLWASPAPSNVPPSSHEFSVPAEGAFRTTEP